MEKSNIIISIIIVLCIAAAVAAYGITNNDNPVFSNLASMGSNANGNGPGNHTAVTNNTHSATTDGSSGSGSSDSSSSGSSSSDSSSSGSSSSGSSNSGTSSSSSGSSDSSGSGSNSRSNSGSASQTSGTTVQSDAWQYIGEEGCYPGSPYQSGEYWIVPIYDQNGTQVDSIGYTLYGEYVGRM